MALTLALSGVPLALAGAALVVGSRAQLGFRVEPACPRLIRAPGLVTTGLYRLVRHPIYSAWLCLHGPGARFGCRPALMIVLFGIVPTFVWRATRRMEETARPGFWRAIRRLPAANQDDHPVPALDSPA
jgi:protein-S-isoprenylcysteine O-methyltransferase Ste14